MRPIVSAQDVMNLLRAADAAFVLASCNEAGVLAALAGEPKRLEELPGDPRALGVVIPILLHLGIVVGDHDRYALSTPARKLLDERALPGRVELDMLGDLLRVPDMIREGGPVRGADGKSKATVGGVVPSDPARSRAFLDMLYRASADSAREVVAWTKGLLAPKSRVLDLGGGHGRYAREFADAGHRATVMDQPLVIEMAKERHGDALDYVAGDFLAGADLGGPYDLVLASNIVHGQSDEENCTLTARIAERLAPRGALVIKDMFLDEHRQNPPRAVYFGLRMLAYTERGRSYSIGEARAWCVAAGLEDVSVVVLDTYQLVIGRRR